MCKYRQKRRAVTRALLLCLLGLLLAPGSPRAQGAEPAPYVGYFPVMAGQGEVLPDIYDFDLRQMLDEYMPEYQSMLLIFTQCYGGDFLDNFAGKPNTAVLSATSPGQQANYGGYENDASDALYPALGRTSDDVHAAGVGGKAPGETPQKIGDAVSLELTNPAGAIRSRHVLYYAGLPDGAPGRDVDQRDIVRDNWRFKDNTTVTLVGAQEDALGNAQPGWDYPATPRGLKAALKTIGEQMNAHEQFILFVSDHGGEIKKIEEFDLGVGSKLKFTLNLSASMMYNMVDDPGNDASAGVVLQGAPATPLAGPLSPGNLSVQLEASGALNSLPLKLDISLGDDPPGTVDFTRYLFTFPEAQLIPWERGEWPLNEQGRVPIVFDVESNLDTTWHFDIVGFSSGPIKRPLWDGVLPPPGLSSPGPNPPPQNLSVAPGTVNVPMLQVALQHSQTDSVDILSLTLGASGTGNDAAGLSGLQAWEDTDGDGSVGAADVLLGSGSFAADNGSTALNLLSARRLLPAEQLLILVAAGVISEHEGSLAPAGLHTPTAATPGWPLLAASCAMLALLAAGLRRSKPARLSRARRVLAALAVCCSFGLLACGGGGPAAPPGNQPLTYRLTLTDVTAVRAADGAPVEFDGLPLAGSTVTATP